MKRITLLLILFIIHSKGYTQDLQNLTPQVRINILSYASSGDELPFWFTSNRDGIFMGSNSTYQLGMLELMRKMKDPGEMKWDFTYGTSLLYGYGENSQTQINQYFAGVGYKKMLLTLGAQSDPIRYGGLSSTNGNLYASNNARPLPGLKLSSRGWIKTPFCQKNLSFSFVFEEKLCDNDRLVQNAHLHHKNLYFRYKKNRWHFKIGLEHYSFWGGTHPTYGQLPEGLSDYLRGITGRAGGADAPQTDQANAAGNQLGEYVIEVEQNFSTSTLTIYWNHLFEDGSGRELANWRDGLWGIHLRRNKGFLSEILYEFMHTKHQSGSYHLQPSKNNPEILTGRGRDNYFNHGVYQSGYVAYNRMMGTPLFIPTINDEGIPRGFSSTRKWMHHIGAKGIINKTINWKGLLTYSRNFGNYDSPLPSPTDQFSFLFEAIYRKQNLPFDINAGIAGDTGDTLEKRVGVYAGIRWEL